MLFIAIRCRRVQNGQNLISSLVIAIALILAAVFYPHRIHPWHYRASLSTIRCNYCYFGYFLRFQRPYSALCEKFREFRVQEAKLTVSAEDATRLAKLRYNGGSTSYIEMLTNDTNYYSASGQRTSGPIDSGVWIEHSHCLLSREVSVNAMLSRMRRWRVTPTSSSPASETH